MDTILLIVPLSFLLDLLIGDPIYRFHPIRIIGNWIIAPTEKLLRSFHLDGKGGGFILLIVTLFISAGSVLAVNYFLKAYIIVFIIFNIYITYSCIAVKDLRVHVEKVMKSLEEENIDLAREQLSWIVGRETENLDSEAISRACVETLAENLSDGIIAPLFYAFAGGAPLAIFYKAANTMDSMVGYKNEKYAKFGYFPAKFDDLMNWIPARLSFFLVLLAGKIYSPSWKDAWGLAIRDRYNHTSPNAGHPEAAMAGVLDLRLGGTNYYHGEKVKKPYINRYGNPVTREDVRKAWKITFLSAILALFGLAAVRIMTLFIV